MQGARGDATRMGSKNSGYRAWAQNTTSRMLVDFFHRESTGRDLVDVTIDASTQNYSAGGKLRLLSGADIDALLQAVSDMNPDTVRHVNAAIQSLEKAEAAALRYKAKRDKLAEKARKKVAA